MFTKSTLSWQNIQSDATIFCNAHRKRFSRSDSMRYLSPYDPRTCTARMVSGGLWSASHGPLITGFAMLPTLGAPQVVCEPQVLFGVAPESA